jgi:phosphoserine phosphatase
MSFPAAAARAADDPLPSWNDSPRKQAILDFVARVTKPGGPDFVPVAERVATFDNDGTLWCEQPLYTQVFFIIDRVREMKRNHPEWAEQQPFKAILEDNRDRLAQLTEQDLVAVVVATHAGVSAAEFERIVTEWLATARHPRFKRPYTELVYQPMLELLAYLRANQFKTFIVSGGGVDFMRPFTERVYGVPRDQVVGSSVKTRFELRDSQPVLMRLAEVNFVDNGPGKPVGIGQQIGRRPIAAFGNSDGDLEMLQWTTIAKGPRIGMIVHHTDAEREYAYDRKSVVGTLDKAWDQAAERGWQLIDMKNDWRVIFPPEKKARAPEP